MRYSSIYGSVKPQLFVFFGHWSQPKFWRGYALLLNLTLTCIHSFLVKRTTGGEEVGGNNTGGLRFGFFSWIREGKKEMYNIAPFLVFSPPRLSQLKPGEYMTACLHRGEVVESRTSSTLLAAQVFLMEKRSKDSDYIHKIFNNLWFSSYLIANVPTPCMLLSNCSYNKFCSLLNITLSTQWISSIGIARNKWENRAALSCC